jgi:hypothetical protein
LLTLRPCLSAAVLVLLAGGPAFAENAKLADLIGPIEEGRTYRRVEGQPITGKDVADLLVSQKWKDELPAFIERVLVRGEMERQGVTVTDVEVDAEVARIGQQYAKTVGKDPKLFTPAELASGVGVPLEFLRDEHRSLLGVKKILVRLGKIKETEPTDSPVAKQAMNDYLEAVIKKMGVVTDPKKLDGAAACIGGRNYSRDEVRAFVLERIGALLRNQLREALDTLTLQRLIVQALKKAGKEALTTEDQGFYFSYLVRLVEAQTGVPDGRQFLSGQLKEKGLTVEAFLRSPEGSNDTGLLFLARQQIAEKDLLAEYQAHPELYRADEKVLAHIFIRVRDAQGRPYTPQWQVEGHPTVNQAVSREREERFRDAKPEIERLIGQARGNFAEAAAKSSQDETTKANGGLIGNVGLKSNLPPPIDKELISQALKLKPGEVSEPLRSSYGWHLVKCLNAADISAEQKENLEKQRYDRARERVYLALLKRKHDEILSALLAEAKIEDAF